jgi:hypothetical protein
VNINHSLNVRDYNMLETKIEWIQITYLSLLQLVKAGGQFKEGWHPEIEKFGDYLGRFGDEIFGNFIKIYESLEKNCDPDHNALADPNALAEFETSLQHLSSPNYEAPLNVDEMLQDLGLLWTYWETCRNSKPGSKNPFNASEAGLDMALVKLSKNIGRWEISAMFHGTRNVARTGKGNWTKKENTNKRKGFVIAIYEHGIAIAPGTKFNMACSIIEN